MPTIFTIDGFRFFFYSNDHAPVHVHVQHGGGEAANGGALIRFPVTGNRRLAGGTPEQLSNMQVTRFGIHWPDLDEDLSFEGLARGDYGQFADRSLDRYPESEVPPLSVAEPGPPPYKA